MKHGQSFKTMAITINGTTGVDIPNDSGKIELGANGDLTVFHDGTDSFIHGTTGTRQLKIRGQEVRMVNEANSEIMAKFVEDGEVELYHNGTKHFETKTNGVKIDSAGDTELDMHTSNGTAHSRINFSNNSGDNYGGLWYSAGNKLEFRANNAERMVINSDGVVDIYAAYTNAVGGTTRDLYVRNDGRLGYLSSVKASKTNIVDLTNVSWLNTLKPKAFNFRKQNDLGEYTANYYDELEYGLIAEDVESVNKELCTYSSDNVLEAVQYRKLVVPLLKAVQDLTSEVEVLKTKVAALEAA